ncbi:MAG TPA: glycosyltransferase family 4 protein [Rhizomicrobium sp.]
MRLLIQGWRGINHSYAMVNQFQLLELLRRPGLRLFHQDLPFATPHWNVRDNASGFSPAETARMLAVPPPDGPVDAAFRIGFPVRAERIVERSFCFATCEMRRLLPGAFAMPPDPRVTLVTPSRWSRAGLVASGIPEKRVAVVPHGVDPALFHPPEPEARLAARRHFGFGTDEFVFLNVSAMTRNKGADLVLLAFAEVRRRHPNAVLVLKDQSRLYAASARKMIAAAMKAWPGRLRHAVDGMRTLSENLPLPVLAALYGAADGYVSPYRAEGFNLPPLEAAACGLPVSVTAGGATDDYADDSFALKLPSKPVVLDGADCIEPELDALIEAMLQMIERRLPPAIDPRKAAARITECFTWKQAVDRLLELFRN